MRSLSLQVDPAPGLEALGECELREQNWWRVRNLIQEANEAGEDVALVLLGVTLHVDGEPIGTEALAALPGRLSAPLSQALAACMAMYATPEAAEGAPPGES